MNCRATSCTSPERPNGTCFPLPRLLNPACRWS
ncbi:MAG: hypothetical protein EOQ54_00905 [Mesorhizobium sp.]|nr:MAG: hypothetical protein EOQ54_00905 [Mesorhizobium sp.]